MRQRDRQTQRQTDRQEIGSKTDRLTDREGITASITKLVLGKWIVAFRERWLEEHGTKVTTTECHMLHIPGVLG